jgi:hypothetical protein
VGPRAHQDCRSASGSGLESLNLLDASGELEGQALQLCAPVAGVLRRLGALAGTPFELVEPGDGVVERRGAEQDGNRIGLSLLVQSPQTVAEEALGGPEVARDDFDLLPNPFPLEFEALGPAAEAGQLAPGPRQTRIEGVEAQEGLLRAGGKAFLLLAQRSDSVFRARAFSPREKHTEKKRGSERQPEREASLPTPTQGS